MIGNCRHIWVRNIESDCSRYLKVAMKSLQQSMQQLEESIYGKCMEYNIMTLYVYWLCTLLKHKATFLISLKICTQELSSRLQRFTLKIAV